MICWTSETTRRKKYFFKSCFKSILNRKKVFDEDKYGETL